MPNPDYFCRSAELSDDIKAIAKYIYLTDPYIYPAICNDYTDTVWIEFISECLRTQDNIFNIENISLVLHNENIVGIACIIPCGKKLNFAEKISISNSFSAKFSHVIDGYFSPLITESIEYTGKNIINICIDENHRNKGIGKLLMSHCIENNGNQLLHLDVIAENQAAIKLYKKMGFAITKEYYGFSGNDTDLLCYHMLYKPKQAR